MDQVQTQDFQTPNSPDKKRLFIFGGAAVALLVVVIFTFIFLFNPQAINQQAVAPTPSPQVKQITSDPSTSIVPGQTKLSDTIYAPLAHQISPGTLSAKDAEAVKGYEIQSTPQADGSTKLKVTTSVPGYGPIEVTVKPGQKAFFVIETRVSDLGQKDADLGDNFVVIVDNQGRIVQD